MTASSKLIIAPTPIGNLADASPRLREAFESADVIACEDSRMTGKLLQLLGVQRSARLVSYHEHNAAERAAELAELMEREPTTVVLVSDAGTPTISDPGYRLVNAAWQAKKPIVALPGPVAAVTGLSASGLPTDRFTFVGFLPAKRKARVEALGRLWPRGETIVGYESPHRIQELLEDLAEFSATSPVYLGRELTKMHEEHLRGPAADLLEHFADERPRGEFVWAVKSDAEPAVEAESAELDADQVIAELHESGVHPKKIRTLVAKWFGLSKSDVFDRLERLK